MKKNRKNKNMLLKIGIEIEKSQKFGNATSKRICTQHILDFTKNEFLSNLSGIKIINCFFGNHNKKFLKL